MQSSGRAQLRSNWAADFETTTDEDDCRVWSWGARDIETGTYRKGLDLDSFVDWVSSRNSRVYFHNLKFDGKFIVPWLLMSGYEWTGERHPSAGEFTTSIDMMGTWYTVIVKWRNGKRTVFQCSVKKLPMSIKAMAKAFELEIVKGEIDYEKPRPVGYIPTPEEDSYQFNDCEILAQALKIVLDEGATRMTVGSDSLAHFKEIYGAKRFASTFPILTPDVDAELRLSYRGGFTYAAKRFRCKYSGRGATYDVNSLYPSVMYNSFLPIGEPEDCPDFPDLKDKNHLFIFKVTILARLKPNHIPCIQTKNNSKFVSTEYLEVIDEPLDVWVTSVDWELWNEHYDIDVVSYEGGYKFRGAKGIFVKYIDHWMEIKANSTGGKRALAKLHLNSLYGKFGTSPFHRPQIPVLGEDGIVRYKEGVEEIGDPVYVAMASFITAYARSITVRAAQAHFPDFMYADTDSLHLLDSDRPVSLTVHPSDLGAWKHEYDFTSAVFSRAKCYTEHKVDGEYETHIAGLPKQVAEIVRFEHHLGGYVFGGPQAPADEPRKLMPKTVVGGVVLKPSSFKLNV